MARKPDLQTMQQLVEIRRSERRLAEHDVYEARQGEKRASEILSEMESHRDDALVKWQECNKSDHIDLGLEPNLALNLIRQEGRVEQSDALHRLAEERVADREKRWRQSDLSLRNIEQKNKKLTRRVHQKRDEKQLSDSTDRHNFRRRINAG